MGKLPPGAIRMEHVSRRFRIVHERSATLKETLVRRRRTSYSELWALRDVSFSVGPGEAVALVGRNGSGKSTTLKLLAGIIPPHRGYVETAGAIASMLELGSGFHPDFTGRENVFMNGAIHGLSERTVRSRFDEIVAFAELESFIDMPVRTYSSGMSMRLAYAVAAHVNPDILLLDEVLAVGDAAFQEKCVRHIRSFHERGGTLVFVSHATDAVREVCERAIVFDSGRVCADGPVDEAMAVYGALLQDDAGSVGGTSEEGWEELTLEESAAEQSGKLDIRLEEVRVLGAGTSELDRLATGDAVTIKAVLSSEKPRGDLDVAIHLTCSHGEEFIGVCSSESGVEIVTGVRPTECSATMQLPAQEGIFDITVVLRDRRTGEVFAREVKPEALRVTRTLPGQGLVAVPVAWSYS